MPYVAAAFAAVGSTISGVIAAGGFVGSLVKAAIAIALNVGISLLQQALNKQKTPGIKANASVGGKEPLSFIVGAWSTPGHLEYVNSWGPSNNYLVQVFSLADLPLSGLGETMWLNDEEVTLDFDNEHASYGYPVTGKYAGYLWVKYRDGTETTADAYLRDKFGSDADRPWTTDMIGTGTPNVIVTTRLNRKLYTGIPKFRFEVSGLKLYDIRKDSTNGGSGTHRWSDQSTWEFTENPAVIIYNILRGITYDSAWVYGGQTIAAERLPSTSWIAAANECDVDIDLSGGGTEPQFRVGMEIACSAEPLGVIEELLVGCQGRLAEIGGVYKLHVGAPVASVYSFTDADIVVTEGQSFDPFPSLDQTINAITATYPEPSEAWAEKEAPPLYDTDLETDDIGRRLVNGVKFECVRYANQAQRLMRAMLLDARRFRTHVITLPPEAWLLEPGVDYVSWTSTRNGYSSKQFLVVGIEGAPGFNQTVSLREVDATDYDWSTSNQREISFSKVGPFTPPTEDIVDWAVAGANLNNRPSIAVSYSGAEDDIFSVEVEVRKASDSSVVFSGTIPYTITGSLVTTILNGVFAPDFDYEVRGRWIPLSDRDANWSSWIAVTTPDLRITLEDIDPSIIGPFDTTPPAVPTGLALSSAIDAGGRAILTATWDANSEDDFGAYDVEIKEGAGNYVGFQTATNRYEWPVIPNTAYTVHVRASDITGNRSAYCAEVSTTSAVDTVPPATPSNPAADGGFNIIWLSWDANTESDLAFYEVYESATTTAPTAGSTATYQTASNQFVVQNLDDDVTLNYWVRALDTSGNKSAWTAMVSGTTVTDTISTEELIGLIDESSFSIGLTGINIVDTLPTTGNYEGRTVLLTTDGKLYRYHSGAWTAAVPTTDLVGTISTSQIAAGAIDRTKIAAGITPVEILSSLPTTDNFEGRQVYNTSDGKTYRYHSGAWTSVVPAVDISGTITSDQIGSLVADKITGQLVNSQIADLAATKITGSIVGTQITDGAISTAKLAANAVVADKIAANVISAKHLVLADFSNIITNDFSTVTLDGWDIAGTTYTYTSGTDASQPWGSRWCVTDARGILWDAYISVQAGDKFYFSAWVYNTRTGAPAYLEFETSDETGVLSYEIVDLNATYLSWVHLEGIYTVPSGVSFIRPMLLIDRTTADTAETAIWAKPVLRRAASSELIVDGAITADKVAANAIVAGKIDASAVQAGNIAANAVQAGNIAANAVTSDTIAANAITASKVSAGAIGATQIAADSISAKHLVLADFSNIITNDFSTTTLDGWVSDSATFTYTQYLPDASEAWGSRRVFSKARGLVWDTLISVQEGDVFYFSVWVYNYRDAYAASMLATYDENGAIGYPSTDSTATRFAWVKLEGTYTIPAGVSYIKPTLFVNRGADDTSDVTYWAKPVLRRAQTSELIVDGAVTAAKVAANAIIAGKIDANAVVAGNIAAGAVTADTIASNAITTGKVAAGAIGADQIAANSITAKQLLLTDFSNIIVNNLTGDDANGWESDLPLARNVYLPDASQAWGAVSFYSTSRNVNWSELISVQAGDVFYLSAWVYNARAAPAYLALSTFDENGIIGYPSVDSTATYNSWVKLEGTYTIPAGVSYIRPFLLVDRIANDTAENTLWTKATMRRMSSAELIVDGAIQANHLTAGEVITGSAQIRDAIITNAKIYDLDAAKITAGTALAGSITVSGRSIGSISESNALLDVMGSSDRWDVIAGSALYYNVGTAYAPTGNSYAETSTVSWGVSKERIPLDPEKLYRVTFKIARYATGGTVGNIYLGVNGYAADRTTLVNTTGANDTSSQHYFGLTGPLQSTVPSDWTEYSFYMKGRSSPATYGESTTYGVGTIATPSKMHSDVKYFSPMFIFNLGSGDSTMLIDSVRVEVVDEAAADIVNAGVTKIDPGKILVSGSTTLADWRMGGDETRINGGQISANTISANKLEVGSRNVNILGFTFEHNSPSTNQMSWTTGSVQYYDDSGALQSKTISAGNATFSGSYVYIYWIKDETIFRATTDFATSFGPDRISIATYGGGTNLTVMSGRTVIDGSNIKTGTVTADRISVTSLGAISATLGTVAIDAANIIDGTITSAKIGPLDIT